MIYAQILDGEVVKGPCPLPKTWRNISGFNRLSNRELARHGWYPWEPVPAPSVNGRTHKVVSILEIEGGIAKPRHEVVALNDSERAHLLAEERRAALSRLAATRWECEVGGIDFDGVPLHTGRESYAAIKLAALEGREERWKDSDGRWHDMSPDRLQKAAQAVYEHRRACFAREEELTSQIRAADTIEALDAIDLEDGWPSTLA